MGLQSVLNLCLEIGNLRCINGRWLPPASNLRKLRVYIWNKYEMIICVVTLIIWSCDSLRGTGQNFLREDFGLWRGIDCIACTNQLRSSCTWSCRRIHSRETTCTLDLIIISVNFGTFIDWLDLGNKFCEYVAKTRVEQIGFLAVNSPIILPQTSNPGGCKVPSWQRLDCRMARIDEELDDEWTKENDCAWCTNKGW